MSTETDAPPADTYEPLVKLRDNTLMWPDEKPDGGWWVTPIHAMLLPTGKVLIVGWIRRDELDCTDGGTRRNGTTFLIDPYSLTSEILEVNPIDEKPEQPGDTIYCGGNTFLGDGRVLFVAGSRYGNGMEEGINYARLYDPTSGEISMVSEHMSGGPEGASGARWYPTGMRLPDGRARAVGGLTGCCDFPNNRTIEVFDPAANDAGDPLGRSSFPTTLRRRRSSTTASIIPRRSCSLHRCPPLRAAGSTARWRSLARQRVCSS